MYQLDYKMYRQTLDKDNLKVHYCVLQVVLYSCQMGMRATVNLSVPRQGLLHEGVSPRATVLVEGLTK